jgi:hypothetical protein
MVLHVLSLAGETIHYNYDEILREENKNSFLSLLLKHNAVSHFHMTW